MHWLLLLAFVVGILYSLSAGQITLSYILAILLVADLVGGVISKFFSALGAVAKGLRETAEEEAQEVADAKTKYPSGKKFIDEGLGRIGKEMGKKEMEREEKKKMKSKLSVANAVGAVDNFLMGFSKLFKR